MKLLLVFVAMFSFVMGEHFTPTTLCETNAKISLCAKNFPKDKALCIEKETLRYNPYRLDFCLTSSDQCGELRDLCRGNLILYDSIDELN